MPIYRRERRIACRIDEEGQNKMDIEFRVKSIIAEPAGLDVGFQVHESRNRDAQGKKTLVTLAYYPRKRWRHSQSTSSCNVNDEDKFEARLQLKCEGRGITVDRMPVLMRKLKRVGILSQCLCSDQSNRKSNTSDH